MKYKEIEGKKDRFLTGFTIIELAVVIAIIAILAAIVIANINSYRNKAKDAAIKGNMNSLPTAATMYIESISSDYIGICDESNFQNIKNAVIKNNGFLYCKNDNDHWVACSPLISDSTFFWCVDNTGAKMKTSNNCNDYGSSVLYCH
ncbi:prepilin-type N-terminal cleavage/methylation domain-containing protein [Patescibacteria group bacterium]|nr:prepilin-type N-terminal cleavage/methylation domain-containing protein [Patescibacteria group bacterium]